MRLNQYLNKFGQSREFGKRNRNLFIFSNIVAGQRAVCKIQKAGSSRSSTISVDYVNNVLDRLNSRQSRRSTTMNYLNVWTQLNKFLLSLDKLDNCWSWEQRTALFGAYLVDNGVQSSTLKSYFSAIKHVLRQDG